MSHPYLFVFGRTPDLAYSELCSFFPDSELVLLDVARITVEDPFDARIFIQSLGGTVKIARVVGSVKILTAQELIGFLPKEAGEVHFGVSLHGGGGLQPSLLAEMKKLIEAQGRKARYAISRHGETLSSVAVDKKHIHELIVVKTPSSFLVGITEAVQPYEDWSKRDYDRPFADAKAGMLPIKVARMLVNIARPIGFSATSGMTLLDPFCGMGTILSEAYLAGWKVLGSDNSADAVQKAKANIAWLTKQHPVGFGEIAKIFVSDAVHISEAVAHDSVHAIVTEPFMGSTRWGGNDKFQMTNDKLKNLKNQLKGLEKLYIGCLRDWSKVLVPGGVVIIALPQYDVGGRVYFVKKVIDMCENLGYTITQGPIGYSRPQATVKRMFYLLRYGTR